MIIDSMLLGITIATSCFVITLTASFLSLAFPKLYIIGWLPIIINLLVALFVFSYFDYTTIASFYLTYFSFFILSWFSANFFVPFLTPLSYNLLIYFVLSLICILVFTSAGLTLKFVF